MRRRTRDCRANTQLGSHDKNRAIEHNAGAIQPQIDSMIDQPAGQFALFIGDVLTVLNSPMNQADHEILRVSAHQRLRH